MMKQTTLRQSDLRKTTGIVSVQFGLALENYPAPTNQRKAYDMVFGWPSTMNSISFSLVRIFAI